jgi:hypothetical protein
MLAVLDAGLNPQYNVIFSADIAVAENIISETSNNRLIIYFSFKI